MTPRGFDYSSYPQISGELFRAVQAHGLFEDGKRFVDAELLASPDLVFEHYLADADGRAFDLDAFVNDHFRVPDPVAPDPDLDPSRTMEEHVDALWDPLTKEFDGDIATDASPADDDRRATRIPHEPRSTLVPLPNAHVVPGGRFRETYYWDSYFTMEGLVAADRLDLAAGMVENYTSLVERFGFVPLGNRAYYDSRSQLPLFYRMLRVLERERGFDAVDPHVEALETEYGFWMDGRDRLDATTGPRSHRRAVALPDGTVVNRYWDDRARPRPESYREDRTLATEVSVAERPQLFRDLRAACESGWDFSSRWLTDDDDLASIRTTEIAPIDLNAVLFGAESALSEWLRRADRPAAAERYAAAADRRRDAIETHFWDDDLEFYVDYCWTGGERVERPTLAGVVPLFTGAAGRDRADAVAERLRDDFLRPGGLVTTLSESGQQWDAPNGWAPLQWMAIEGLRRYDHDGLADEIADRWIELNRTAFEETGRMAEKYDVRSVSTAADNGEYPLQYGFGWTNGIVAALTESG
ncbi:MAG: trehalase family glycosidase [Haloferacaceae archaeon]